jgi:hypothetical protein
VVERPSTIDDGVVPPQVATRPADLACNDPHSRVRSSSSIAALTCNPTLADIANSPCLAASAMP